MMFAMDLFVLRQLAAKYRLDVRTLIRARDRGVECIKGEDARQRVRAALADLASLPTNRHPHTAA